VIENFRNAVPVIGTSDVAKTIHYFENILAFKKQWVWGDPPTYAGVRAGGALLYISSDAALAAAIQERKLTPDIFLWVTDIERVYSQHRANGAEIAEELATRPWGARQYAIREPNGYLLKIAEDLEQNSTA
jgi:catechol 2,3-dioxygenase-like lactoylglutathione lyase family enzyme